MHISLKFALAASISWGALALGVAGCGGDLLTYSQDFKKDGMRQYDKGDYSAAAGSFQAAARQDPTDYQTQYYLGESYDQSGRFHQAVEAYELCLKLMPQTPAGRADVQTHDKVFKRLGDLIASGDSSGTEINTIEAEAQSKNSAEDYHLLARIFAKRGDADSAMDSYRRAISFATNDFALVKEYGLYLVKVNQTNEASRVLQDAAAMDPSDKDVRMALRQMGVSGAQ